MALKTLIVKAGSPGIVKPGLKIISVASNGTVNVTSNCPSIQSKLTQIEEYQCYEIVWEGDDRSGGSGSWEVDDVRVTKIDIAGTAYNIDLPLVPLNTLVDRIKNVVPSGLMLLGPNTQGQAGWIQSVTNKVNFALCFKTLPSIAGSIYMEFSNPRVDDDVRNVPPPIYRTYARPLSTTSNDWCKCPDSAPIS